MIFNYIITSFTFFISPEFNLPGSSQTISELLENSVDYSEVRMVLILDKEDTI